MIYLDNQTVLKLADPADLVAEVAKAFAHAGDGPERLHCDLPGDDGAKLLVMPAWIGREAIGVKVATVMPGNGNHGRPTVDGLYVLLDGKTGQAQAVLSAPALTAVRTAAVSALAASYLARRDSRTFLMIGTRALAPHLIRAHCAVRQFDKVLVWGRDPSKARTVVAQLAGISAVVACATDLSEAVAAADVISSATSSARPLIMGAMVKPGTHVDLVGSFTPQMREADADLFARGRLAVDTAVALKESGDLLELAAAGIIEGGHTPNLGDLVRDRALDRKDQDEITIFKAVGTGLADLAVARRLYSLRQSSARRRSSAVQTTT